MQCLYIFYHSGPQPSWHQGPVSWKSFSTDWYVGGGFRMIQAQNFYCVFYFYYYYISPTSDNQALDPRDWGALFYHINPAKDVLISDF